MIDENKANKYNYIGSKRISDNENSLKHFFLRSGYSWLNAALHIEILCFSTRGHHSQ